MAMQASKEDVRQKSPIRRHSTTIGINSPPQRPNDTNDRLNFGSSARGSGVYFTAEHARLLLGDDEAPVSAAA